MEQTTNLPATIDGAIAGLPEDLRQKALAEAAEMKRKIGQGGGDKIRLLKKKAFKLPDGRESAPGDPLRVVVLDFIAYNAFFDRPYNEKEKVPPACFALANVKPVDLVPSPNSPAKQSEACKGCPNNEFGTKGAGKACGNHYILAVTGVDKADSEMYTIQLPPTSGKYWEAMVNQLLARHGMLPAASIEVYFDPEKEHQLLRFGTPVANPFLAQHLARKAEATARLQQEPDVSTYEAPKKPGKR